MGQPMGRNTPNIAETTLAHARIPRSIHFDRITVGGVGVGFSGAARASARSARAASESVRAALAARA